MSQACLDGITLHDVSAFQEQPDHTEVRGRAAHTNLVLRHIYPRGKDIATLEILAFFRAGQVDFMPSALSDQRKALSTTDLSRKRHRRGLLLHP